MAVALVKAEAFVGEDGIARRIAIFHTLALRRTLWLCAVPLIAIAVLDVLPARLLPGSTSAIVIVLAAFVFMIVHGWVALGWRALLTFFVITYVISFAAEVLGVATGLVFGPYHYTDNLGPKIFGVPPLVQLAYIAMGYASMMTGRMLVDVARPTAARWLVAVLAGTMLMVGWDVSMDPYMSTVGGNWIWEKGGAYFGVPTQNYVGWVVTVLLFMLVYALVAHGVREDATFSEADTSRAFWNMPVFLYAVMALNIVATPLTGHPAIAVPANFTLPVETLEWSLTVICVFVMGTPIALALLRRNAVPADE